MHTVYKQNSATQSPIPTLGLTTRGLYWLVLIPTAAARFSIETQTLQLAVAMHS